jgi:hypothetical protein
MADIFLHTYNITETTSTLNAPHKYRFAKKKGMDTLPYERAWQTGKMKTLNQLVECIKGNFDTTIPFAYSIAPSTTKMFVNDIEAEVAKAFPNAINLSKCFSKVNCFEAGKTNEVLTEEQLRNSIILNRECFNTLISNEIQNILLLDDVFALGNTFNAMRLAIEDVNNTKTIITAVILKTT